MRLKTWASRCAGLLPRFPRPGQRHRQALQDSEATKRGRASLTGHEGCHLNAGGRLKPGRFRLDSCYTPTNPARFEFPCIPGSTNRHGISDSIRDSVSKITAAIRATSRSMDGRIISCRIGEYRGDAERDSGMAMVSVRD